MEIDSRHGHPRVEAIQFGVEIQRYMDSMGDVIQITQLARDELLAVSAIVDFLLYSNREDTVIELGCTRSPLRENVGVLRNRVQYLQLTKRLREHLEILVANLTKMTTVPGADA